MKTHPISRLQYISQGKTSTEQLQHIQQALVAGCDWIQLRWKHAPATEVAQVAQRVKALCDSFGATLIINDFPHIAQAVDAHGVHLGLADMSVAEARTLVGPNKIIGGTANTLEDVLKRYRENCHYVGLGPLRFTTTKENLSPILGITGYQAIIQELESQSIAIPIVAIGGVQTNDVTALIDTGVHGIAVSGLITQAADKKQIVTHLRLLLEAEKTQTHTP